MKYNSYICYLIDKYNIALIIDLNEPHIMEYYQEFLLNIMDFMMDYINSNVLQFMYYDLYDEIFYRVKQYTYLLGNCTKNYTEWLDEDYKSKLSLAIGQLFRAKVA